MAKTMRIYPKKTVNTQIKSEMNMKIVESDGNDPFVSKYRQEGCQTNQIKSAKSMQFLRAFPRLPLLETRLNINFRLKFSLLDCELRLDIEKSLKQVFHYFQSMKYAKSKNLSKS